MNMHASDDRESCVAVFAYYRALFYLMLGFFLLLLVGVLTEPPNKLFDILAASVLLLCSGYMVIQSKGYRLQLEKDHIRRISPWIWHRDNIFHLNQITTVDIPYKALHVTAYMNDGREFAVPLFLKNSFRLLDRIAEQPNVEVTEQVRKTIVFLSKF